MSFQYRGFRLRNSGPDGEKPGGGAEDPAIMLVDMDSFFAQVEQRNNPKLRGKPVLVGGNAATRHGVVAAASYEAKAYGVKSGMSYFEAKQLCPDAIMVFGNTNKYVDCCYRLLGIFREFTDLVECYSIDEAFLDMTHAQVMHGANAAEIGRRIKRRVMQELNLTCSIGIGPNKLVAKMACKWDKPDGLTIVDSAELPHILWNMPVDDLVGVGRRMKKHLNKLDIYTIGDLAKFPKDALEKKFGVYGGELHNWANAIDETPVNPGVHMTVKSMGHSYTLPRDVTDPEEIRWYLFWLSDKVARRLRNDNYRGRTISIVVRDLEFSTISRDRTIPFYTNSPHEICDVAETLLAAHHPPDLPIRLLGVTVTQLIQGTPWQMPLFGEQRRLDRATRALDVVKDKYGEHAISFASIMNAKNKIRPKIGVFLSNHEKGNARSPLQPPA